MKLCEVVVSWDFLCDALWSGIGESDSSAADVDDRERLDRLES